jgi:hypothetical protein
VFSLPNIHANWIHSLPNIHVNWVHFLTFAESVCTKILKMNTKYIQTIKSAAILQISNENKMELPGIAFHESLPGGIRCVKTGIVSLGIPVCESFVDSNIKPGP